MIEYNNNVAVIYYNTICIYLNIQICYTGKK